MKRQLRNLSRIFTISRVLARHDALFLLQQLHVAPTVTRIARIVSKKRGKGRPGERLAQALQELGPTFIKFGQALATRPDIVGDQIAKDLTLLQDRLPPFSFAEAKAIIETELGKPLTELYASFVETPEAAASIAQVHFATDTDGRELAVKVLRPGVEQQVKRDLEVFYWVAALVEQNFPKLRRLKPIEVVRTFEQTLSMEMDLRFEAAAASEMRENFANDPHFYIPMMDWPRISQRVMTMERIYGVRIDDRAALLKQKVDIQLVLTTAARIVFQMVFRDGFFHADMHPGNMFVDKKGRIILIDFGIMGRVDRKTQRYVAEMLYAYLKRDFMRVAEIHIEAGYVPAHQSKELFAQASRSIAEPILGLPQNQISIAKLLEQLFKIAEQFEMQTQPQLLLIQKNMMLVEGVARFLDPSVNVWKLAEPLMEQWAKAEFGPRGQLRRLKETVSEARETLDRVSTLSKQLQKAVSPEGIRLHSDTIRQWREYTKKEVPIWFWVIMVLIGFAVGVAVA